ncbi:MAG: hypothetical protein C0593_01715 [Marinilabiliales bacterium]|nr:MAG: hypothetical protein C0593_01715 [Marinilabiliales bacterium]
MKLRTLIIFLWMLFSGVSVFATHQRAGEILYRHIDGLTYEVIVITYTYSESPADRCELEILWGDGNTGILPRINGDAGITPGGIFCEHTGEMVDDLIRKNVYSARHTYASAGDYTISVEDPNRNYGVINIPNSVNIPLYIDTRLLINPFVGINNSPELLLPPIDKGCVEHPFIHNPGAWDPDGDSLSYELVACRGAGGLEIPGYTLPEASESITINEITGDIVWESPVMQGEYNIAFLIKEYRNGQLIGHVTRDMQIIISACDNEAPTINTITDTCIMAGDVLIFTVSASDVDNDNILLTGTGGPMLVDDSPATFPETEGLGFVASEFRWNTNCSHVQKSDWQMFFKATDDSEPINLSDIKTVNIKVVAPPPELFNITPVGNSITIEWLPYECDNAITLDVYRRPGSYNWEPGPCDAGLPSESGYVKVAEVPANNVSLFTDDDNGAGLVHGINYCYRLVAVFADGAESYASNELCTALKKDMPVITHATVESTSATAGETQVMWSMPTEIDYEITPGPFRYNVFRFSSENPDPVLIETYTNLEDTIFTDTDLNTQTVQYEYYIEFLNETPGNEFIIGNTKSAQTPFLSIESSDSRLLLSWSAEVPWVNTKTDIFRYNEATSLWDSLTTVTSSGYTDTALINEQEYCYYIRTRGSYSTPGITTPLLNLSQEACGVPEDNIPPCPVTLFINTNCDIPENRLRWTNPEHECGTQTSSYTIYAAPDQLNDFFPLDSLQHPEDTTYTHAFDGAITGCYFVVAVDEKGNRSEPSNIVCIPHDTCSVYKLPNVFTPNGDGYNDFLTPFPYTSVERVDAEILNRWGQVVFRTDDPNLNWDGRNQSTSKECATGVYFYVIDLHEITLQGVIQRTISGQVHLLRE